MASAAAAAMTGDSMLVITGSPGSGKSALLSRIAVLADPRHRPDDAALAELAAGTVPGAGALHGVVWCHNKTERDVIEQIATALGGRASTPESLLQLAAGRKATIAIDALDEIQDGLAREVASRVLRPLAEKTDVRLLIATRRKPVRDGAGGEADLLSHLGVRKDSIIDLDNAPERRRDMRDYVRARILAASAAHAQPDPATTIELSNQIVEAAGYSFLVAAIAARAAGAGKLSRHPDGRYVLPTEVGEALAAYINALPDPDKSRALLRPLAWSLGAGMPWGTLWPQLATALARVAGDMNMRIGDEDVRLLLDQAGDLVVETNEGGQPVYRLFHEALAENLRADTEESASHDALASAMRDVASKQPWHLVQRYIAANLPVHLLGAGRMDELVELLSDATWDRSRREETGDPLAAVGIAAAAIERLLADSPTDLRVVPLCFVHSRAITSAPPLIIDILARGGQLARAEMMANNLAYAPDRMLAYRYLGGIYGAEGDTVAARRCYEEVRRSLLAMPQVHQPMAWYWVADVATDAQLTSHALEVAKAAVEAAFAVEGDGWDLPNAYFWAGKTCRLTQHEKGMERLRAALDKLPPTMQGRNQALQAASVTGHRDFLRRRLDEYLKSPSSHMIREGNLALALMDAGMASEAVRVFKQAGKAALERESDTIKRWAWALAIAERMDQALRALDSIGDPIERGKAISRISDIASARDDRQTLAALAALATTLYEGAEPRSQARLIRVLWLAGKQADALSLTERTIASAHVSHPLADPRDELGTDAAVEAQDRGGKTAKREMISSVVPVTDETWCNEAISEAEYGTFEKAADLLARISVPKYRARAQAAIAGHHPDHDHAVASWLAAMADARRAGRGVVGEIAITGVNLSVRWKDERPMDAIRKSAIVEKYWTMESFSEQYEALRQTLPPGRERTLRMTNLLLIPHQLAHAPSEVWDADDVRATWRSGEDGKRLFALGLMQARPQYAEAQALVEGIRASRSAFEQYNALLAASIAQLKGEPARAVREAVAAELRGEPRADGVDSGIATSRDRLALARQILGE